MNPDEEKFHFLWTDRNWASAQFALPAEAAADPAVVEYTERELLAGLASNIEAENRVAIAQSPVQRQAECGFGPVNSVRLQVRALTIPRMRWEDVDV